MMKPPLQFFLGAIASAQWSDVSIITSLPGKALINPTFTALELLHEAGLLGSNVTLHKVCAAYFV